MASAQVPFFIRGRIGKPIFNSSCKVAMDHRKLAACVAYAARLCRRSSQFNSVAASLNTALHTLVTSQAPYMILELSLFNALCSAVAKETHTSKPAPFEEGLSDSSDDKNNRQEKPKLKPRASGSICTKVASDLMISVQLEESVKRLSLGHKVQRRW